MGLFQIGVASRFEIDGLPDTARLRIPMNLFAGRQVGVGAVFRAHRETDGLAGFRDCGKLDFEGDVAAFVRDEFIAIGVDRGFPVDCAKDDENTGARVGGNGHIALIPCNAVVIGGLNPGEFALPGEGHVYRFGVVVLLEPSFVNPGVVGIEIKAPRAVEIYIGTRPIRTGMKVGVVPCLSSEGNEH